MMTDALEVLEVPQEQQQAPPQPPPQPPQYAGVLLTTDNCLQTLDQINDSPSRKDGLTADEESKLRHLGCEYIQIAGIPLRVPQFAVANAQVLFQRYYCIKSFVKCKMEEVAMACIWLASKIEESPRRVRDVINVFHMIKQKQQNPKAESPVMELDSTYSETKAQVLKYERRVLKELGFCVHVKHPHKVIIMYLKYLQLEENVDLVQVSWNFMNDSMRTTLFVQYKPETIACACISFAACLLKVPLPSEPSWVRLFGATEEEIEDIIMQMIKAYHERKHIELSMANSFVDKIKQAEAEKNKPAEEDMQSPTKSDDDKQEGGDDKNGVSSEDDLLKKSSLQAGADGDGGDKPTTSSSPRRDDDEDRHEKRSSRKGRRHRRDRDDRKHGSTSRSRGDGKHSRKHSRRHRDEKKHHRHR